jgi:hypothetical protein
VLLQIMLFALLVGTSFNLIIKPKASAIVQSTARMVHARFVMRPRSCVYGLVAYQRRYQSEFQG